MENEVFRWALGIIGAGIVSMLGWVYKRTQTNEQRLHEHDIMFAKISELPHRFGVHEREERKLFHDINNKLTQVQLQLASMRKIMNGDK